jgi:spore coat protein U-like protein
LEIEETLRKITVKPILLSIACMLILAGTSAFAGTATSNMSVSATVSANCTISAGAMAFGAYDPVVTNASSPLAGTATLTVACTNGAPATLTMDQGLNPAGGSTNASPLRQMASGGNFLSYSLYQDNAMTVPWGNTGGTGAAYTGTGVSGSVTVYGQVGAGQNVSAGTYNDTVVATITF